MIKVRFFFVVVVLVLLLTAYSSDVVLLIRCHADQTPLLQHERHQSVSSYHHPDYYSLHRYVLKRPETKKINAPLCLACRCSRWVSLLDADGSEYTQHCSLFHVPSVHHHFLIECHRRHVRDILFQQKRSHDLFQISSTKIESHRIISHRIDEQNTRGYVQTKRDGNYFKHSNELFTRSIGRLVPNCLRHA